MTFRRSLTPIDATIYELELRESGKLQCQSSQESDASDVDEFGNQDSDINDHQNEVVPRNDPKLFQKLSNGWNTALHKIQSSENGKKKNVQRRKSGINRKKFKGLMKMWQSESK